MLSSVLCLIDARNCPERSFFQKSAILNALKKQTVEVSFVFLLSHRDDAVYIPKEDKIIYYDEFNDFEKLLTHLKEIGKSQNYLIISENDVYPNAIELSTVKEKKVFHPSKSLIFKNEAGIYSMDYPNTPAASDWCSVFKTCFVMNLSDLQLTDRKNKSSFFESLRESFVQFFRDGGFTFVTSKDSYLFLFEHTTSYQEVFHDHHKISFFSGIEKPRRDYYWPLQAVMDKKHAAEFPKAVGDDSFLTQVVLENSILDPRWKRLKNAKIKFSTVGRQFEIQEEIYRACCQKLQGCDYVMVLHQLRRGGAEKEAVLHLQSYCQIYPERKVGLLLTSPIEADLEWQLPSHVQVVEVGKLTTAYLNFHEISYMLYRVLDQIAPRIIHVKGSHFMWHTLERYGRALAQKSKIITNLYCIDYDLAGRAHSFSFRELVRAAPFIDTFLSDNQNLLEEIKYLQKIVKTKKIFYPAGITQAVWSPKASDKFKLLWCSRLTFQKDVRTLYLMAQLFHQIEFHVFGEQTGHAHYIQEFTEFPNIKFWGIFDGIEDIDLNNYDAFLYTSYWDGLPNIVLEIGSQGMPVIAPNVGGLQEILVDENSFLYSSSRDLVHILQSWDRKTAAQKAKNLVSDISRLHSWGQFHNVCREIYE